MTHRHLAALCAACIGLSAIAQDAPDADTFKKASYAIGLRVGKDVQQNEEVKADRMLAGFEDTLSETADTQDVLSYATGVNMAMGLMRNEEGILPADVLLGLKAALSGAEPAYSQEELEAAQQALQQQVLAKRQQAQAMEQQAMQQAGEANLAKGEAFLQTNAAKDGVMVTPSGLQYQVIKQGEGDKPAATDTVTVHYTGRLLDGTVFDSSVERGQPVSFPLSQVIPGWTEGLQLMAPGAKYRFWIPSGLAYGPQAPPAIGPNQVLDFEVELIKVGK